MDRSLHVSERFIVDERGAVTTDWVVLTGAAFLLAVAVVLGVRTEAVGLGDKLDTSLDPVALPLIGGL